MAADAGKLVPLARDELIARIAAAQSRIWLASPFLTSRVAASLVAAAKASPARERRLLTAVTPGSVQVGVLDPRALSIMLEADFEVASIPNLHAKVSLVDSAWGLVGSGNLTDAGLGSSDRSNVELGVVLSQAQIGEAETLLSDWWARAKPVSREEIKRFAALPRIDRREGGVPDFGEPLPVGRPRPLDELLAEDETIAASRGYWVKSNYHRTDEESWWRRNWISDWRQAPYEVGDLIVLYLSARDGGPAVCPAIVQVESPSRYDPTWVIEHRDPDAAERWPYVTETSCVNEVPISDGVPLSELGLTGQSLQGGYCRIGRDRFERALRAMSD